MLRTLTLSCFLAMLAGAQAAPISGDEAQTEAYFDIWSSNATVTQTQVDRFYATNVDYYGQSLNRQELLRNKLSLVRLWPLRKYHVEPGSLVKSCAADGNTCEISVVLNWQSVNPARLSGTQGKTTVSLSLVREDGVLKIRRENGVPIERSQCRLLSADWARSDNWQCSALRFPPLPGSAG